MATKNDRTVFLKGKRIILSPLIESDIAHFVAWANDREIGRFNRSSFPKMECEIRSWYKNLPYNKPGETELMIVRKDKVIGHISLSGIHSCDRTGDISFCIADPNDRRKGYCTEALRLMLEYAFDTLNVHKVCATVFAFNDASLRVLEKCGFAKEGVLRQQRFCDGTYHDEILFGLLREDYAAHARH